jgi:hypothetical protein
MAVILGHVARAEAGIRQFLDIGSGMPTAGNTHEVVQAVALESLVVYAGNDHCKTPGVRQRSFRRGLGTAGSCRSRGRLWRRIACFGLGASTKQSKPQKEMPVRLRQELQGLPW